MTRMISELAKEQRDVKFHMTSLKPITPQNKPSAWEKAGLLAFEKNQIQEYYSTDKKNGALIVSHLFMLCAGVLVVTGFGNRIVKLTENLKQQSNIDGLTQIANRRFFDETFHREWLRSRRLQSPLSLIMCDIDHFKLYNDAYGHQAGDTCLKKVAQALSGATKRPKDLAARYGGEEFVIILPETPPEGATVVAEQVREAVESLRIRHSSSKVAEHVTISLGVATTRTLTQVSAENELIESADKALYASKVNGRNIFTHVDDV